MKRILVVGGGFAGLWAALAAQREIEAAGGSGDIGVTVVSRDAYLTIRPRLYQCDPESLRTPLRPVLDPVGVALVEGRVGAIDTVAHTVTAMASGGGDCVLGYDRLVLAAGSEFHVPPIPGAAEHAFNIDDYGGALAFDRHLRGIAAKSGAPGHNGFVIIGGGFTGIELAMEMRTRIAAHANDEVAAAARIVLIERADAVGPELGDNPRPVIEEALRSANVEVRTGTEVAQVETGGVVLVGGDRIDAATTVIAAGLRANRLAALLPVDHDAAGRIPVDDMLRVGGVADAYATGDIARAWADHGRLALMSCQHALTMGRFAGYNAARDLLGLSLRPYRQERYVTCLDLGTWGAVFTTGWERKVEMTGAEAKRLKIDINTRIIYPPTDGRAAILAAAAIDPADGG